jgi:class 3 adenylate cyclase
VQLSKQYDFDFAHSIETLWAIVADTPRWGEASGLPRYQASEQLQPDGSVKVFGKLEFAGIGLAWEELPANWLEPHWFEQQRLFSRGPIRLMTSRATLQSTPAGSHLRIELTFESDNLIGKFLAKRLLAAYPDKVAEVLTNADRLIRAEQPQRFVSRYQPSPSTRRRALQIASEIAATPFEHGLCGRLIDYINGSQEIDLSNMRPLAIARRWQAPQREVIELFLQSVRAGLLESRWDILCPRCRVGKAQIANMSELPKGAHCDACNIDFDADFAHNVELSFSPSPSIRPVGQGYFCRSGPGVTPHIKSQCSLPAGESRTLPLTLAPGSYRIRTLEAGEEFELDWRQGPFPRIRLGAQGIEAGAASPPHSIAIENHGSTARTLVIEQQGWRRDVLTAAEVTTLQAFRDLFSDQLLRPGDDVSIRHISFLFTDLIGSSALFAQLGDARAYRLVREHFAELGGIVRRHDGSIVKTVGDGIHAAFAQPDDALRAALAIQHSIPGFNRRIGAGDISIRIGLHAGSSIAVTLNQRLDYYGEAVNLAARLEGQGEAGEITMSASFADDPAVAELLRAESQRRREVSLKGFRNPVTIAQIEARARHDEIR